ncbi:AhpC/TSA family protein [Flavobacteriaceae bacterium F08102]|nr:AhpC/TSA family protein [Flavobacteriaceae bacterium F08102]
MKYNIATIIGFFFISMGLLTSCKTEVKHNGYYLKGTVNAADNSWVKLVENLPGIINGTIIDSALVSNGKFEFKGKVDHVDYVNIAVNDTYKGSFFLENKDMSIELIDNSFTPVVKGSSMTDELNEMNAQAAATFANKKYDTINSVSIMLNTAKRAGDKSGVDQALVLLDELTPLIEEQQAAVKQLRFNYVKEHPDSPVAVHVLGYQFIESNMTRAELTEYYHLFTGDAKKTFFYREHMTKVYKNAFENLQVGTIAPDFTLQNYAGNDVTLSEVKAKYILVDFWASWCVPCRASFPHLKKLYAQYKNHGDFEVIGVGTADTKDKLMKAVKEDQTPWMHVYDVSENHAYGAIANKYGVPHLPTTFLLDGSTLEILLRDPRKGELDTKLKELFGY